MIYPYHCNGVNNDSNKILMQHIILLFFRRFDEDYKVWLVEEEQKNRRLEQERQRQLEEHTKRWALFSSHDYVITRICQCIRLSDSHSVFMYFW